MIEMIVRMIIMMVRMMIIAMIAGYRGGIICLRLLAQGTVTLIALVSAAWLSFHNRTRPIK